MTDAVIKNTLAPTPCKIIFDTAKQDLPHPNTMVFSALKSGKVYDTMEVYSVGGGSIEIKGRKAEEEPIVYRQSTFNDIAAFCTQRKIRLWQYVEMMEGPDIWDYLLKVWKTMCSAIDEDVYKRQDLSLCKLWYNKLRQGSEKRRWKSDYWKYHTLYYSIT